jgi:Hsp90 protein
VTTAQYNEFYKYIANAYDVPMHTLHFRADAPIDLKVLLYVPSFHTEKFGMGRIEAGEFGKFSISQEMHKSNRMRHILKDDKKYLHHVLQTYL